MGEEKPKTWCGACQGRECKQLKGLLDTGEDVMFIPSREWLSHCELQSVAGHVHGIGSMQLAKQSKDIVQI